MSTADLPPTSITVTCTAPVNIAVVKYWGKRDEKLILPVNSSLSGTISQDSMRSKTTIVASPSFAEDSMTLNGKDERMTASKRLNAVLTALRARAGDLKDAQGNVIVAAADWPKYKLKVTSDNNFPTAAGLASSASGFACFTACLASLFGVVEAFPGELSAIARQGSGSACRSLYGGWVKWNMGERADGQDSFAEQVADEAHWPDMRVLILVAHGGQKEVPSTSGMETTVQTSALMAGRTADVVPARMAAMEAAIKARDFASFAEHTMRDSNQFHAVCLDTLPPIFYLNDTSKRIIAVVHALNAVKQQRGEPPMAAYTFDAGPNAVLYLPAEHMDAVLAVMTRLFHKPAAGADAAAAEKAWISDPLALSFAGKGQLAADVEVATELLAAAEATHARGDEKVYNVFVSKLGSGPVIEARAAKIDGVDVQL